MPNQNKGIVKTAIVTPDKHFPLHDQKAINVVCKAIEIVKPNVYVDLGDTGEWEHFSTHYWKGRNAKPMEDLIPLLNKDIKAVNKGMDQIDKEKQIMKKTGDDIELILTAEKTIKEVIPLSLIHI